MEQWVPIYFTHDELIFGDEHNRLRDNTIEGMHGRVYAYEGGGLEDGVFRHHPMLDPAVPGCFVCAAPGIHFGAVEV